MNVLYGVEYVVMKINLTKKQFETLLKLVYLGDWLANANRVGQNGDERIKEFDELEEYLFSFAKEAGLERFIEFDKEFHGFFPTLELENAMWRYIEEHDEEPFWDELFERLSERDFFRKYPEAEVARMEMKERFEREEPFRERWDKELRDYGIERVGVKDIDIPTECLKIENTGADSGDEVIVGSPAGSKNGKFRHFAVLSWGGATKIGVEKERRIQKAVRAIADASKYTVELEELEFGKNYALLSVLISPDVASGEVLDDIIIAANGAEPFLRFHYLITNARRPTVADIKEYLQSFSEK